MTHSLVPHHLLSSFCVLPARGFSNPRAELGTSPSSVLFSFVHTGMTCEWGPAWSFTRWPSHSACFINTDWTDEFCKIRPHPHCPAVNTAPPSWVVRAASPSSSRGTSPSCHSLTSDPGVCSSCGHLNDGALISPSETVIRFSRNGPPSLCEQVEVRYLSTGKQNQNKMSS